MKYRKKPLIIEAVQYHGDLFSIKQMGCEVEQEFKEDAPVIKTLEGELSISPGDYVIKGIKGEFYPCKPDIFEASYEPVE